MLALLVSFGIFLVVENLVDVDVGGWGGSETRMTETKSKHMKC